MAKSHFTRIVIVLFLVFSGPTLADITVKVGQVNWTPLAEMLWVQREYDNSHDYESPYFALGYTHPITGIYGVMVEGYRLGSYHTHSEATGNEPAYGAGGRALAGPPEAYCSTSGYAFGLTLAITAKLSRITVHGGATFSRQRFNVQIYNFGNPNRDIPSTDITEHMTNIGWTIGGKYDVSKSVFVGGDFYRTNDSSMDIYPSGMGNVGAVYVGLQWR